MMRRTAAFAVCVAVAGLWSRSPMRASGVDIEPLPTFSLDAPLSVDRFSKGELGLVKRTFRIRFLVQAYRVLHGQPSLGAAAVPPQFRGGSDQDAQAQFWTAVARISPGPHPNVSGERNVGDYVFIVNCNESTWTTALRTLNERVSRYGPSSREAAEWLRGQQTVLRNCDGDDPAIPDATPLWADAMLRADREYQIASAYFYATDYEEAARRFTAIASDATSPWRVYGRYLAARSMIRQATVHLDGRGALLADAEGELRRVIADRDASPVRASAQGLLHFVAARLRPEERLREVALRISDASDVSEEDVDDYVLLVDSSKVQAGVPALDDLTDWIATSKSADVAASQHAISRWRQTQSLTWLLATLWTLSPQDPSVPELLGAVSKLPRTSPAYLTAMVQRLRLLLARGADAEVRRIAMSIPTDFTRDADPELANVSRAARMRVATSFDTFLDNAPRALVSDRDESALRGRHAPVLTFDEDSARIFSQWMPLDRLIEAANSTRLPARLRMRLAQVSFTRAVLLKRYDAGLRIAPTLAALAPRLRDDLSQYINAADDLGRKRAAVLLFLRTPGMRLAVWGLENSYPGPLDEPAREYRVFENYWWCGPEQHGASPLIAVLMGETVPPPSFLTMAERTTANREVGVLKQLASAGEYLTSEAIAWAQTEPTNPLTAEALARSVREARFSRCGTPDFASAGQSRRTGPTLSQRAFVLLHRLHPNSEWARRTPYWY